LRQRLILRTIVNAAVFIFLVVSLNFVLIHISPGDPIRMLTGEFEVSEEYIQLMRQRMGLDLPILRQLLIYYWNFSHGDLGYSFIYRQPVMDLILSKMPATLLLLSLQLVASLALGITAGMLAARHSHRVIDNLVVGGSTVGMSIPGFWFGMMLILLFAMVLGWFPAQGMTNIRQESVGARHMMDILWHATLPAASIAAYFTAVYARFVRTGMLEVLEENFVYTARSKGLRERIVMFRHILPNALPPLIALVGANLGPMITGSVVIETLFAWPGVGRLAYDAMYGRDYPLLMGIFLVVAIVVILGNFSADLLHMVIDPRIDTA
jgi:peptide/nickel transport system permease protein